jgi:hypothetical protein
VDTVPDSSSRIFNGVIVCTAFRPGLGPTQPPNQCVPGPGSEVDYYSPCSVGVNDMCGAVPPQKYESLYWALETNCHRQLLTTYGSFMCGKYRPMCQYWNRESRLEAYPELATLSLEITASISGVGWKQNIRPKHYYLPTRLHGVITQVAAMWRFTAAITCKQIHSFISAGLVICCLLLTSLYFVLLSLSF